MAKLQRAKPAANRFGLAVAEFGRTRARLLCLMKPVAWVCLCLLCFETRAADFETIACDDIAFIQIPAGTFIMGTTEADRAALVQQKAWSQFEDCELPAHLVTISHPFLISKCEITQQQWK